jgi:hypothetical protein
LGGLEQDIDDEGVPRRVHRRDLVCDLGCGIQGFEIRLGVECLEFRVWGLWFGAQGRGFEI